MPCCSSEQMYATATVHIYARSCTGSELGRQLVPMHADAGAGGVLRVRRTCHMVLTCSAE